MLRGVTGGAKLCQKKGRKGGDGAFLADTGPSFSLVSRTPGVGVRTAAGPVGSIGFSGDTVLSGCQWLGTTWPAVEVSSIGPF